MVRAASQLGGLRLYFEYKRSLKFMVSRKHCLGMPTIQCHICSQTETDKGRIHHHYYLGPWGSIFLLLSSAVSTPVFRASMYISWVSSGGVALAFCSAAATALCTSGWSAVTSGGSPGGEDSSGIVEEGEGRGEGRGEFNHLIKELI